MYTVPTEWDIGKVYVRLVEDAPKDDVTVMDALFQVYSSAVSDEISNFNSDFFYQPRGFIREEFFDEKRKAQGQAPTESAPCPTVSSSW